MSNNSENQTYQVNYDLPPPTPIASPPRGDDQSGLILDSDRFPMTPYIGPQAATEDDIIADDEPINEQPANVVTSGSGSTTNLPQTNINVQPPAQPRQQSFQNPVVSQYNTATTNSIMPPPSFNPPVANAQRYRGVVPRPIAPAPNANRYRLGAPALRTPTIANPPMQRGSYGPSPRMIRGMVPMQRAQAVRPGICHDPGYQTRHPHLAAQSTQQFYNSAVNTRPHAPPSYATSLPSQLIIDNHNPYARGITTAQQFPMERSPMGPPQQTHVYPNIQPALSQPYSSQYSGMMNTNTPPNSNMTAVGVLPQMQSNSGPNYTAANFDPRFVNCTNSVPISQPAPPSTITARIQNVIETEFARPVVTQTASTIVTGNQSPNNTQANTNPIVTQAPAESVPVTHQEQNSTQIRKEDVETFLLSFQRRRNKIIREYPLLADNAPNATKECQNFMKEYSGLEEHIKGLISLLKIGMYH